MSGTGTVTKICLRGSHRVCTPAQTNRTVAPLLGRFGITRVANVTGLDRIGIPVFMAVRPNSRSLSVAQGKGADADSARASAVMEAIEAYHAEFPNCLTRIENFAEMRKQTNVVDPALLPLRSDSLFAESRPIPWTLGRNLVDQEQVWVPFELVHANAALPRLPGSGCFCAGTNGLASGNVFPEAVVHGLCETVERDALTLWQRSGLKNWDNTSLALDTVDDPACVDLLRSFHLAGMSVSVWEITSDIGIAAFYAVVFDQGTSILQPLPAAFGSGCHPDKNVALSRALTEAAQSRLTVLVGSRDDLSRTRFRRFQSTEAMDFHAKLLKRAGSGKVVFANIASITNESLDEDIKYILGKLRAISISQVIAVDLSYRGMPISVARVIVPGLEPPSESLGYKPGPRLRAKLR